MRIENGQVRIKDQGSGIEFWGLRIKEWGLKMEDLGLRIEDQQAGIGFKYQGMRIWDI